MLRIDIAERLIVAIDAKISRAGAALSPEILNLAGCGEDQIADVLDAIGYKLAKDGDVLRIRRLKSNASPKAKRKAAKAKRPAQVDPNSPFAKLQDLALN